jgi:FMN phosphatase YigB (HAD superfamily)
MGLGNAMKCRAIIYDYIGTLVNCRGYNMADSENTLYNSLYSAGFRVEKKAFLDAYRVAHKKYRVIRYEQYREVTNAVWVAEALTNLGYPTTPDDPLVKEALNIFFQDFINTIELRDGARELLEETSRQYRLGLISNFTYGPVIHNSLRKIGISQYFNALLVSDDIGWRKPSPVIFQDMLQRLGVSAAETVFVGDSPMEDIKGALDMGLRAVFVSSQFNSLKDLKESNLRPDCVIESLQLFPKDIDQLIK